MAPSRMKAQIIAQHYDEISNSYSPVNTQKLCQLKSTRSTLEIDLSNELRKEFSVELSAPMSDIINTSLTKQIYPKPNVTHLKKLKDLRKISSTSDFNKV